jgi:hypothetical protein
MAAVVTVLDEVGAVGESDAVAAAAEAPEELAVVREPVHPVPVQP